ncbi:MAG TPA: type II secretion system F family protein [Clostridiales bacterium]|nr:type II secretion system F family protein [Clostridiales bacterium]
MSLFHLILLFLIIISTLAIALSNKRLNKISIDIDRKDHKLFFLYPMVDYIITILKINHSLYKKDKVSKAGKALNVTNKVQSWEQLYWYRRISLIFIIIYVTLIVTFLSLFLGKSQNILINNRYIARPSYGEGNRSVELNASLKAREGGEGYEESKEKLYEEKVTLNIEERSYEDKEIDDFLDEAANSIEIYLLGDNKSKDQIHSNLTFYNQVPGTSVLVDWKIEDLNIIGRNGELHNEKLEPKGIDTMVTAVLSYQDREKEYPITLHIMAKQYTEEEKINNKLKEELVRASEDKKEDSLLELPDAIEGYQVTWDESRDKGIHIRLLGLGLITVVLVWVYQDKDIDKQMKDRREEMLLDYPELINKFNLLINAGMTVRQAWIKITDDYKRRTKETASSKRYAYEEMLFTKHELELGVSELSAYESFGRRTGLTPYMKFSTLIAQNLKKGSKGLSELLSREAREAYENRKETAKRLGEEAGTKLLAPMRMMLIIVFILILIPAFISFGI